MLSFQEGQAAFFLRKLYALPLNVQLKKKKKVEGSQTKMLGQLLQVQMGPETTVSPVAF